MKGEKAMKRFIILNILSILSLSAFAQKENHYIRSGNSAYRDSDFEKAEVEYRRALEINPDDYAAQFNLGNALYQQADTSKHDFASDSAKYESAARAYRQAAKMMDEKHKDDPIRYAKAKYNEGNCYKQLQQIPDAINAYKDALRKNPKDEEARRNLAMLMKKPPQSQSQGQGQGQGQNNQEQDQEQQQQQQQQEQQEQQQQQEEKMDQETAEQLLQALEDKQPVQPQGQKRQLEKNW